MTQIAGFVLRSCKKHETAQFYEALGLSTHEHEHGGPSHYEVGETSDDFVVEIYQQSKNFPHDALMLEVRSIAEALTVVARFGIQPRTGLVETLTMKFVYITDPDGRDVMLIEKHN